MAVTQAEFRKMALSFPETEERQHMNHPDFRTGGKIFATLHYPDEDFGMVKLTPAEQQKFLSKETKVFSSCAGVWGQ
jgi:YjbR